MALNMDQTTVVQGLLCSGDKVLLCIEAGLVQDWVKSNRVLALVERSGEHAVFVLVQVRTPSSNPGYLSIEKAIAVNDSFRCDIETSGTDSTADDNVYLKITGSKQKLLFELPYNAKTKNFASQVSKASETFFLKMGPPSDFQWLAKYQPIPVIRESTFFLDDVESLNNLALDVQSVNSINCDDNFSEFDNSYFPQLMAAHSDSDLSKSQMPSPEFGNLPRQSIAMGVTPLAARESVIRLQMTMREDDYVYLENYTVFMGTWNVNGQSPKESLKDWLSVDPTPPDFYVVGFQELDLSKEAYLFTDTPKEDEWLQAVKAGLNPSVKYKMVKLIRLVGMMMIVFIKEELAEHVKNVAAETVGTGLMGKLGNKGGVAVRLDYHLTTICFVNCHLAAHMEECERRNQDYSDICARIAFSQFKPPKSIKDHDHIYWMGDMNYRIMDLDCEQVKALIEKKCYSILLEHDQLTIQNKLKKVFVGFNESQINFAPTYKYDTGTSNWDSSEKNRPPAWCDRILWKGSNIKQFSYRSHPTLMYSDHKPVSGLFQSKVKVVDVAKYRKIYEEVMKKLDKLENEFLPQVSLDKLEVNFDKVHFIETKVQNITIANTGQVPVQFEFKKKLNDTRYCKDWLSIKPYTSFLKPGEKCDVDLEVFVDKRIAYKLNAGKDKIYDILVLHLEGGKDLFITVSGTFVPGCFGASLEALVRIPVPITELPVDELFELENAVSTDSKIKPQQFEIPKEMWVLIDHLYKFGLTQKELFLQPGLRYEMQKIRDKLDNGIYELGSCSIHSVAECFLLFLEALAEPVIPYEFYYKSLECSNNFISCRNVVNEIPKVHRSVFRYLISFLREILNHSISNRLDGKLLATIFGGILLREPLNESPTPSYKKANQQAIERKKATFIFHFLMNDLDEI
ncbi:type II inositol 1,4,5-trisphosphate 5-phosphatase-like [Uloborus diversus]|uniref:type II inositol 1,4,5-trisphosphate 5-phosphatase-like n=1 Tax=Uloborus diversus TaxID=327109 RepID=UPI002409CBB7|nr:type II inositol 1,4,5-trisphosphate 5-phosphatase-like [Uloborus diversus]